MTDFHIVKAVFLLMVTDDYKTWIIWKVKWKKMPLNYNTGYDS